MICIHSCNIKFQNHRISIFAASCTCRVDSVRYLQVQVFDSVSERVDILVTGISIAPLNGDQMINKLIDELRGDIKAIHEEPREGWKTKKSRHQAGISLDGPSPFG
jgi:hypothetical protein